MTNNKFLVS